MSMGKRASQIETIHLLGEFFDCRSPLSDLRFIRGGLRKVIKQTALTELHSYFHKFKPYGVTGVIVLKQSHISIHTWPEDRFAAVDLFTCGERKEALRAFRGLAGSLRPKRIRYRVIKRGSANRRFAAIARIGSEVRRRGA